VARSQIHKKRTQFVTSSGNKLPRTTAVPTVTGTNTVGQTLTGTNATFSGSGTVGVTRQWTRNGSPIPGATGATYELQEADVGKIVRFVNIGSSRFGSRRYTSLPRTIAAA
jgi:hypothetical protein